MKNKSTQLERGKLKKNITFHTVSCPICNEGKNFRWWRLYGGLQSLKRPHVGFVDNDGIQVLPKMNNDI